MPLFGLIAIGYLTKKARILHVTDADVLSRFVVDVTLPALVVDALLHNKLHNNYIGLPLVIWLSMPCAMALGLALSKLAKFGPKQTGTTMLLSGFGNTGFLGYPMTMALHPNLIAANVILDQVGMSMLVYPVALVLGGIYGRAGKQTLAETAFKVVKTPVFVCLVLGLTLRLIPIPHAPHPGAMLRLYDGIAGFLGALAAAVHLVGSATIPVVLVAIGIRMRPSALKAHIVGVSIIGLGRLIVAPILGFLVARYVLQIHDPALLMICVVISGTPPSAAATVMAGQYDMDGGLGVAAFVALTILYALTMPLMLTFLH